MNKESILHIPMSQYAHGIDENRVVFRLRSAKEDLKTCTLYYGDTACRQNPIIFHEVPMHVVASDELFDYFEVELESLYHRIYYYFKLDDGDQTEFYYSDFFRSELVDDRSEYYKLPFNHKEDIMKIPEWVNDAVIYNIFPDSFATDKRFISNIKSKKKVDDLWSHSRLGGTIKGIEENVDYLKELGINCIYINPIFTAGEYHKYDTVDYFKVDPCFGTNDEFKQMVKTYHDHDIKVIIDGVFNHCGWQFYAFEDVVEKGEDSKYWDWFYRLESPVIRPDNPEDIPNYECFAYERLMPKLDTGHPDVRNYLLEVGKYWIEEFDIDGWRLDVASEVDDHFWRAFRRTVKDVKPDSFIIGEVWESAQHWLDGSMYDSTMNYDLRKHCKYFFADNALSGYEFDARVTNMRLRYRKNMLWGQLNLLDSHDVSRFYSVCNQDIRKFKLAVLFQMMFIGVPSIYYGDEQLLHGIEEIDYRRPMEWDIDKDIYKFYKNAIAIRKENKEITHGDYRTLHAKEDSKLYIFERYIEGSSVVVVLNPNKDAIDVEQEFVQGEVLFENGFTESKIDGFGYAVFKKFDI
ncbi:MAG: alpha-glycosidase [Clostridiales bacterium]|nr:alpha-glycosidase [Clostridiales bacterium]